MSRQRMHPDEIDIDAALVQRLLTAQFPGWAHLPIEPVRSAGTVNAIYRLGPDKAVRLPRVARWADGIRKETTWLPRLAPQLPLAVPIPLALGRPDAAFPLPWAIYTWLDGDTATSAPITDMHQAAADLASFIRALRRIDPTGAPISTRGDLPSRNAPTRAAIAALDGMIDKDAATAAWDASLAAPPWDAPLVWIHGDLLPTNLLVQDGRLSAVIDFGSAGLGDPAFDLLPAWSVLPADTRNTFRSALTPDAATWLRGRGFALSVALIQLPYYQTSNPILAANARHVITEVLTDFQRGT